MFRVSRLHCSPPLVQSVMVSIQSLMDDRPYHNEPGFEKVSWLLISPACTRSHIVAACSRNSCAAFALTVRLFFIGEELAGIFSSWILMFVAAIGY